MNLKRSLVPVVIALAAAAGYVVAQPVAPDQPIPFSHKAHAGVLKVQCKMCHANAGVGETMGIAGAATCMQCHSAIKTDSPSIQKLAAFAKNEREIKWARVYQVPDFVRFSHRAHLDKGTTCAECHGQVVQRDQLFREVNLSMSGCMDCHRAKKASIDCMYCHDQQ